ncbi:transposable element Tcb1 transposase [Trichonephila clavipes]|uniref:Transposable element Tcb1 transposase n=1 Tax=Trichonephila clavipes TaxID=2585209 RepID=A0A8X6WEC9_TRICX|nr:transposable element Tcb1 transposase [Trichonephila clavipes]
MFTYESRFVLEPDDKRIRIWRKQGTRNQPQNITEHHAFRSGSIMVWAKISLRYRTDLHISKRGSVMAVRYRDEVLEPIVRLYAAAVGPTFVLMDDNARPHRADIVDDYLESEGIARMAWPAYSPDLNPIENLWDALGHAVSSRFPPLATLIELETALQEEWRLLNSAVVDHLIESMVRRSVAVGAVVILVVIILLGLTIYLIQKKRAGEVVVIYKPGEDGYAPSSVTNTTGCSDSEYSTVYYDAMHNAPYPPTSSRPRPSPNLERGYSKPVDDRGSPSTTLVPKKLPADIAFGSLKSSALYNSMK